MIWKKENFAARMKVSILYSQDRYLFWSTEREKWLVDAGVIYNDNVAKHTAYGFIFSETKGCPGGHNAIWSQYQEGGVFKHDPEISVKMVCRTKYGKGSLHLISLSKSLN